MKIVIPILTLAGVAAVLVAAATVAISAFDDHQAYAKKKCQTDKKCLVKQKGSVARITKVYASGFDTAVNQEAE
jgi:Na+-transporting NADH:ubiquinone oxidoreductase subunit NqrC